VTETTFWPNLAIVGGNQASNQEYQLAKDLGKVLASYPIHLICGGKTGIMEAVAQGFQEAPERKGIILGIMPGEDKSEANPYLDMVLPTGLGLLRNGLIARSCDAMIAIGGGSGTLSELVMAWHENKPLAILGASGWYQALSGQKIDQRQAENIQGFKTLEDIMPWIKSNL